MLTSFSFNSLYNLGFFLQIVFFIQSSPRIISRIIKIINIKYIIAGIIKGKNTIHHDHIITFVNFKIKNIIKIVIEFTFIDILLFL